MEAAPVEIAADVGGVAVGIVTGVGCRVLPTPASLRSEVSESVSRGLGAETEATRQRVRSLLRHGKFKPTGRSKPASEYLAIAAAEGRFPTINNLVDVANWLSFESRLPISLIDRDRAGPGTFVVRRGRSGESYVFNESGHAIDLVDLLLVATRPDDRPCANPVKDAMWTKVTDETTRVLAVVYAPEDASELAFLTADRLCGALTEWGDASAAERWLITTRGRRP
jgi:DNA/RNA-binding domain of Phe-tRNA-synthetase-like protein